jgi:PKD repeat protein
MAKPVVNFSFKANGLSVQFTDGSSGIIASWLWDFGFQVANVEQTSTQQNPAITFPNAGFYNISLAVTNSDGTSTLSIPILVSATPSMNISIRQMVQYDLPIGVAFDSIGFMQSIRKWQLWLQAASGVSDDNVFDETQWPSLYNVLISKMIIMDLVVKAARASMSSYMAASESYNQLASATTGSSVFIADYMVNFDGNFPITINQFEANGLPYIPIGPFANAPALIDWLNGLSVGQFALDINGNIVSNGNQNLLTTFNYTSTLQGYNESFIQANPRIESTSTAVVNVDSAVGAKGAVKAIETGPSKAQWYDSSLYWSQIFRSAGSDGKGGGVLASIQQEICMFAGKLTVKVPGCVVENITAQLPMVFHRCRRPNVGWPVWPASNSRAGWWNGWWW